MICSKHRKLSDICGAMSRTICLLLIERAINNFDDKNAFVILHIKC